MSKDKIDDGGSVSPMYNLTLRDYFAAKAMQAMVGNYRVVTHRNPLIENDTTTTEPWSSMILDTDQKTGEHHGAVEIAGDAYAIADAMLAARKEDKCSSANRTR